MSVTDIWRENRRCPIQQNTSQPIAQNGGAIIDSTSELFFFAWPGHNRSGQMFNLQAISTSRTVDFFRGV